MQNEAELKRYGILLGGMIRLKRLKLGMIGLDTSHCPAFAKLLLDTNDPHHVEGAEIVAAFPGGSEMFANSRNRVAQFTAQMRDEFGVKIYDTIEAVAEHCDAILLESVDGRQHLEQFAKLAPYGKPVFIDKPLTTDTSEAKELLRLANTSNTPVFSASSLRYAHGIRELGQGETVHGCEAFGPMAILDDFPGLFWYGIHSAEILFSKMGVGCREVTVVRTESVDIVTGIWEDGRVGTLYGHRFPGNSAFGATVYAGKSVQQGIAQGAPPWYALLLKEILPFFKTGEAPIDPRETLEIIAFLEAANTSRETGEAVSLNV